MKTQKIFLTAFFFIFILENINAQAGGYFLIFMGKNNQKHIGYQVQQGTIQLKNGEVITGRFKYDHWMFPVKNFAFYKSSNDTDKEKIKVKNIRKAMLEGADTSIMYRNDSTEFVNIKSSFYRTLAKGQINVYDKVMAVNEVMGYVGQGIYIESEGKLKRIESLRRFNKWYQGLAESYPNLKIRNEHLSKIEIIREIQKYNVLKE